MIERLEIIKKRYDEINEELLSPEVIQDYSKQQKLNKEKSSFEDLVLKYLDYQSIASEIKGLRELIGDPEMGEIAKQELEILILKQEKIIAESEMGTKTGTIAMLK